MWKTSLKVCQVDKLKMTVSRPFWLLFLQNLSWVILVRVLTFCSICMVQLFCFDFELRKYYKNYSNSKWPLDSHFKIVCSQMLIRSLNDIAVHICQIKRKSAGNFFLKCATSISLLVALVINGLIIWESKCHQKSSGVI